MNQGSVSFACGPMLTEVRSLKRVGLVIGTTLVLVLIVLQFASARRADAVAGPIDPSPYRLPAEDLLRLGLTTGDPPTLALSAAAAQEIATALYDPAALGATSVADYLETVTVDGTARGQSSIVNRAVWIVKMSGMSQEQGGPMPAEGAPASIVLKTLYVFIDATSGEFLFAEWQQ